jgi:glycosyltransferase involved in cell wall biosynthesis
MQAREGDEVLFVGAEGSFRDILEQEGVATRHIPLNSIRDLLSASIRLRRMLTEFDPDIVHAHMVPGALLSRILRQGSRFRLITTVHSSGRFASQVMMVGDLTICVSSHLAREMKKRGIPARKIRVVLNGPLNSPRLSSRRPTVSLTRPAVVTVAELAVHKGIGDLISAFSLLPESARPPHLYIIGDGPDRTAFERQAGSSSCADRIVFLGSVTDPIAYLQSADIFVLASHREGFGLVLAEARSAGCAVIATEVGGVPEVLEQGRAGLLIPPRCPSRLAHELTQLLQRPTTLDLWQSMARRDLDWLSCQRMAAETAAVYREALGLAASLPHKRDNVVSARSALPSALASGLRDRADRRNPFP